PAQEALFADPNQPGVRAGDGQFILNPVDSPLVTGSQLFLDQAQAALPPGATNVHGFVNNIPVGNNSYIEIGFDYIRPLWSFRDFNLAVPAGFTPNFPLLGNEGHVDDHFAIAPRINLHYRLPDTDFGLSASGSFLNLTGDLHRTANDTAAGTAELTSTASLTLTVINFAELSRRLYFEDVQAEHGKSASGCFEDLVIDLSIAGRYAALEQSYTGDLTASVAGGTN